MGKKELKTILILFLSGFLFAQNTPTSTTKAPELLQSVLDSLSLKYPEVLKNPERYKLKMVFTQIKRSKTKVSLETVSFREDQKEYLYPASIVKLPTTLISLEEFNNIKQKVPSVTLNNTIKFFQKKGCLPTTNQIKIGNRLYPTSLDVLIKMTLAVSDNDAYNRLYDFCGQQKLNSRIKELGFKDGKIIRKFVLNCNLNQNRISDSLIMLGKRGERLYTRGTITNTDSIVTDTSYKLGLQYEGFNKQVINKPFDFSKQNNLDLLDIHKTLAGLVFPKSASNYRFNINEEQRKYLLQNLGRYPDEYGLAYNSLEFFPTYKKYLLFGRDPKLNYLNDSLNRFRSLNIVGVSFGCVIDCAYLIDFQTGKEFILTVGMYANQDEVINDAKYDYDNLAYPFMKDVGRFFMNAIAENPDAIPYLENFGRELEFRK
jgi:hypothetical protein